MSSIVVAMSGGVDSAVTACLLHAAGHNIMGIHMRTHSTSSSCRVLPPKNDNNRQIGTCCSPYDARDASDVADKIGFPFIAIGFEKNFEKNVIDPFISDYKNGRTPSPCVDCNNKVKMGELVRRTEILGYDYVATGHYARIKDGRLYAAVDKNKDQSYYLAGLTSSQISRLLFPLGEFTKSYVRDLAREYGLEIAEKPDSQEICFAPKGYRAFLESQGIVDTPGNFVSSSGTIVGTHKGVHNYTVGQRTGLGLEYRYVLRMNAEKNEIVVGSASERGTLTMMVGGWSWLSTPMENVTVKIRSRSKACKVKEWRENDGTMEFHFDDPIESVAPGQLCVMYDADGNEVHGSGRILN